MKKVVVWSLVLGGVVALVGCSTFRSRSTNSLENRVQTLETRVQAFETNVAAPAAPVTASTAEAVPGAAVSSVIAETMSKKDIQKALKNAGYYDGDVDGKIGPKTKAAIMDFQKGMGLKADGIAGRITKEKLLKYLQ